MSLEFLDQLSGAVREKYAVESNFPRTVPILFIMLPESLRHCLASTLQGHIQLMQQI